MKSKPDYSFEVRCIEHRNPLGATCFSTDVTVRDPQGNEVLKLTGRDRYEYAEAAEDAAIDAARSELRRLRGQ